MQSSKTDEILKEIRALRGELTGDLRMKAERLDKVWAMLSGMHISIDKVFMFHDDDGNPKFKVSYYISSSIVEIGKDGIELPEFIRFANELGLIQNTDIISMENRINNLLSKN